MTAREARQLAWCVRASFFISAACIWAVASFLAG